MRKTFYQTPAYFAPACRVIEVNVSGLVCQSPSLMGIDEAPETEYGPF